jgi:hypothetical protein
MLVAGAHGCVFKGNKGWLWWSCTCVPEGFARTAVVSSCLLPVRRYTRLILPGTHLTFLTKQSQFVGLSS